MSAVTVPESADPTATGGVVFFTPRGEAALDQLATVLTAHCSGTPEGIAQVLDKVMHADMADLTEALTAIAEASEQRSSSCSTVLGDEASDAAAQRRLGRRDAPPATDGGGAVHGIAR
jgi:hypothetical protein